MTSDTYRFLSNYSSGRDNNFNLLRFVAASMVLVSHSSALSLGPGAKEPLEAQLGMNLGNIAVDIFFVTSGFLVTGSLVKRRDISQFLRARIVRVFPGLIASIVVTIIVIGATLTKLSIIDFVSNNDTWKFLVKNSILVFGAAFVLPGTFEQNPIPKIVNGSLWTLPWEARLYLSLGMIGTASMLIRRFFRRDLLSTMISSAAVLLFLAHCLNHFLPFVRPEGLRVGSMFFVGSAYFLFRDRIILSSKVGGLAVLILMVSSLNQSAFFLTYNLIVPYIIFTAVYLPGGVIRRFNQFGDYSYGMYVYGFPAQQTIVYGLGTITPVALFLCSFPVTLALAMASWHLVEKRFLKNRERTA